MRKVSTQQHKPITVGLYYPNHPVNFPCGRKPDYPEKTHDFRQSVDYYSFEKFERVTLRRPFWESNPPPTSSVLTTSLPKLHNVVMPTFFICCCQQYCPVLLSALLTTVNDVDSPTLFNSVLSTIEQINDNFFRALYKRGIITVPLHHFCEP